ncbi:MAG: hypothetical protein LH471_07765, partial [Salinibacterium sp.]|nr:hypothetical protein [Salinibacterium sp.]
MSTVSSPTGASFARKRRHVVASIASIGALAGLSLAGATPALAATDADCQAANTVDADAAGTETDIQNLLNDVTVPVVCLSGTFVLTTTLNYDRNLTIFGLPGAVLDGNNLVRILDDALLNSALTVENLRLTQGGNGAGAGGAVSADVVFVQNSIFDNNSANFGGAISASEATIEGSTFTDNLADFGGAVVVVSDVTVTDSTFALNEAGTAGGAIISYGTATVNSSTFADNSGGSAGGAIVASSGVDVINSTFVRNSTDDGGAGGAIAAFQGAIVQSTFIDNSTGGGDGESLFSTASEDGLTIQGNIFAGTGAAAQVGDSNTVADLGGNIFSTSA